MDRQTAQNSSLLNLVQGARDGDAAARERLFFECREYLHLLAKAQVQSWLQAKFDASDLCQQTLLEAHRAFADFRGNSSEEWLAWLRTIMRHNAVEYVRRYRGTAKRAAGLEIPLDPRRSDMSSGARLDPSDSGPTPSGAAIRREDELLLAEAISALPADYQDVIVMRHLEGLPFDQIAKRLGRSRGAAQMLWLRAVRKLQELCPERK